MKQPTTKLFLARHGETEWNQVRRLQGHLNSRLTDNGLEQAQKLALLMRHKSIDVLVSSPLERALDTARVCQKELSLSIEKDLQLIERNFGSWQGKYFDELNGEDFFEQIFFEVTEHAPPNGESGIDCAVRIKSALEEIAEKYQSKKILIITHGDAIRCLLSTLSNKASCDAYSQYGNGNVFPLEFCNLTHQFNIIG